MYIELLDTQQNKLLKEVVRSWNRLSARESELVAELDIVMAKAAEPKMTFYSSAARVRCSEGELARLIVAQAK